MDTMKTFDITDLTPAALDAFIRLMTGDDSGLDALTPADRAAVEALQGAE